MAGMTISPQFRESPETANFQGVAAGGVCALIKLHKPTENHKVVFTSLNVAESHCGVAGEWVYLRINPFSRC
jgi:hypothetical protein